MAHIIIPTYNRSAKLARTLQCYSLFKDFAPKITLLDGSDKAHMAQNQKLCRLYKNVEHIDYSGIGLMARLMDFFKRIDSSSPVCLATDEDVFLPEYISTATQFLNSNPSYSMFVGRYVTFARPMGPFKRIVHHRNVVTDLDINQEDICQRSTMLSYAITIGSPPVYWGVRRASQFLESLRQREPIRFYSSHEMVDQILLAHQGKIKISNMLMLFRDETKIDYVHDAIREHATNYFPPEEEQIVSKLLFDIGGKDLLLAGNIFMDRYLLKYVPPGHLSLALQKHHTTYSKYNPLPSDNVKVWSKIVFIFLKAATIFSEILTTPHDIRVLKNKYGKALINTFLTNVKVSQKD